MCDENALNTTKWRVTVRVAQTANRCGRDDKSDESRATVLLPQKENLIFNVYLKILMWRLADFQWTVNLIKVSILYICARAIENMLKALLF